MKLILAADLKDGLVVHGKSGDRDTYLPLTWGRSPSAEPLSYCAVMQPKYLYVADLDRIEFCGDHTETILKIAPTVSELYVDRGTSIPEEYLPSPIKTIVGTETIDAPMDEFHGGFLSIDIKDGKVIPEGADPITFLQEADKADFEGYIILNISSVGTESGLNETFLKKLRNATRKPLFYGGGVASKEDVNMLERVGFNGAIVATAVHKGTIPLEWIQRGERC